MRKIEEFIRFEALFMVFGLGSSNIDKSRLKKSDFRFLNSVIYKTGGKNYGMD